MPPSDDDGDGNPDVTDTDSDNDNIPDGTEAFDLDGDGTSDIQPSGEDVNDNGVDDAYDGKISTDQISKEYIGEKEAPRCKTRNLSGTKRAVLSRLAALSDRVPIFGRRALRCGGSPVRGLRSKATAARRAFEQELERSFGNEELVCPRKVCPTASKISSRANLNALASKLFLYAKRSKLNAIKICNPPAHRGNDPRPQTKDYLAALKNAIAKLPAKVSECE